MRTCPMCGNGDRKAMAVCNRHDLGTLAALSFSNSAAPFLAAAKLPSIKHSAKSILPRFFKSMASFTSIFPPTLFPAHSRKRRWQVWQGGVYPANPSRGAVRHIHRIPFKILRSSTCGRPDTFLAETDDFISGKTSSHCSLVISMKSKLLTLGTNAKN